MHISNQGESDREGVKLKTKEEECKEDAELEIKAEKCQADEDFKIKEEEESTLSFDVIVCQKGKEVNPPLHHLQDDRKPIDAAATSPSLWPQIVGGGVAALAQVALGMVAGYSGVTIPQLTSNSTSDDVFLDQHQVALYSSLLYLSGAIGCIIGIVPMVHMGQRITMLMCLPVMFIGWMALAFSTTVWMIQTSRFLIGLTIGVTESASYQYATEVAHSQIRGKIVGALDTMRQVGVLLVFATGATNLTWQNISLICGCTSIPPVFVALLFLPNSPRWLATHGRIDEARKSLSFYRGAQYDVSSELVSITNQLSMLGEGKKLTVKGMGKMLLEKNIFRIIAFFSILFLAAQFTGNIAVLAYTVPIFEVAQVSLNSYLSAVIISGIRIFGTICCLMYIDYGGRRPALIVSFFLCGVSLISLGIFFFIKDHIGNVSGLDWLPLSSIVIFTFFSMIGHPTMNVVRGELLPTSVRSMAMPFLLGILFGGFFFVSQTFPMMSSSMGEYGTFWFYGGMCFCISLVSAMIIPETCNKNLENIEFKEFKIFS